MTVQKRICQKCLQVRAAHHECHPNSENYLCQEEGCTGVHHMSLHDPMQALPQKDHPICGVMTRNTTTTRDQDKFAGKILVDAKEYDRLLAYVERLKQVESCRVYEKVEVDNGVEAVILHDSGSEVSFVTQELVDKLELDTNPCQQEINTPAGNSINSMAVTMVQLPLVCESNDVMAHCFIQENLGTPWGRLLQKLPRSTGPKRKGWSPFLLVKKFLSC